MLFMFTHTTSRGSEDFARVLMLRFRWAALHLGDGANEPLVYQHPLKSFSCEGFRPAGMARGIRFRVWVVKPSFRLNQQPAGFL